jgi:hypothetical protein
MNIWSVIKRDGRGASEREGGGEREREFDYVKRRR